MENRGKSQIFFPSSTDAHSKLGPLDPTALTPPLLTIGALFFQYIQFDEKSTVAEPLKFQMSPGKACISSP